MVEYVRPNTLDQALTFLGSGPSHVPIAGGTDLVLLVHDGLVQPDVLIDISGLEELQEIQFGEEYIEIGAATKLSQISRNAQLPACLCEGASHIGSVQIRNLGTIGGNICNASPCGDTLIPLLVLEAILELRSQSQVRRVPATEFFVGPKKTVRRTDELLVRILIPKWSLDRKSAFAKIGGRQGMIIAQVNAALSFLPNHGRLQDPRIAFGSVAPTPLRTPAAEAILAEGRLDQERWARIAAAVQEQIRPICDQRGTDQYRREVAPILLRDLLGKLGQGTPI